MEITDPEEDMEETGKLKYRIVLRSQTGPVDVHLVNTATTDKHESHMMSDDNMLENPDSPVRDLSLSFPSDVCHCIWHW